MAKNIFEDAKKQTENMTEGTWKFLITRLKDSYIYDFERIIQASTIDKEYLNVGMALIMLIETCIEKSNLYESAVEGLATGGFMERAKEESNGLSLQMWRWMCERFEDCYKNDCEALLMDGSTPESRTIGMTIMLTLESLKYIVAEVNIKFPNTKELSKAS